MRGQIENGILIIGFAPRVIDVTSGQSFNRASAGLANVLFEQMEGEDRVVMVQVSGKDAIEQNVAFTGVYGEDRHLVTVAAN